ncbi:E3 ubiquitin-protein ligase FANCL-like isoform X2 [Xenia sp. Carnegie-2017]|uniref:E3 ubiquitin-protein ligase FANCL-like isoform X2 n=1 Tax=Xenia sp. Carnegie-2017 TaxID=2897299 RepID=UPI001F03B7B2|nr:E3 ubiquitin-protein ligase FANCL-like isoform X2 [Xenia sp. Carnegie-2017]
MSRKEELYAVCPLLVPQDRNEMTYDGFINIYDKTYRLCIARKNTDSLKSISLSCSWRLWNILHPYKDAIKHKLNQCENLASFLVDFKNLTEKLVKCNQDEHMKKSLPLHVYSLLMSELEAIGWDKLMFVNELFNVIKLKARDIKNREHVITIHILQEYPNTSPVCSVDLPQPFHIKDTSNESPVKDIYTTFCKVIDKYQEFWNVMDEIDEKCWVLEPENPKRADTFRRIALGSNASLLVKMNVCHVKGIPECHFLGPDSLIANFRQNLYKNLQDWNDEKDILENMENVLLTKFPSRQTMKKEDFNMECGICYSYRLNDVIPESACNDSRCGQLFHTSCLYEWLRGLSSCRQSFNIIFGECPYCNKPITVKVK